MSNVENKLYSEIMEAVWDNNMGKLHEIAACICCCWEHTFPHCPARLWGGCRSSLPYGELDDTDKWVAHYKAFHNMSEEEFFLINTKDK